MTDVCRVQLDRTKISLGSLDGRRPLNSGAELIYN